MCGQSVHERLVKLNIINSHKWTHEDDNSLMELYGKIKNREGLNGIAKLLKRSRAAIACRANELGITRNNRPLSLDTKDKLSHNIRYWYKNNEHPKGYLGKKHSPETRELLRMASGKFWDVVTEEQLKNRRIRQITTRIKNGTNTVSNENTFSRCKRGKRKDLGDMFFRSSWEANYARYLNFLIVSGLIIGWEYEAERFWFNVKEEVVSYCPDFKVEISKGKYEFHEVKGWMTKKSKISLDLTKKYYPEINIVLIDERRYLEVRKLVRNLLPGWEG
jgi:hypothetical protein